MAFTKSLEFESTRQFPKSEDSSRETEASYKVANETSGQDNNEFLSLNARRRNEATKAFERTGVLPGVDLVGFDRDKPHGDSLAEARAKKEREKPGAEKPKDEKSDKPGAEKPKDEKSDKPGDEKPDKPEVEKNKDADGRRRDAEKESDWKKHKSKNPHVELDDKGRPSQIKYRDGSTARIEYDEDGKVKSVEIDTRRGIYRFGTDFAGQEGRLERHQRDGVLSVGKDGTLIFRNPKGGSWVLKPGGAIPEALRRSHPDIWD